MQNYLSSLSYYQKKFQTPKMKVPVIFCASDNLLPDEEAFRQLEKLAEDPRIFNHIAALPDVHPKAGRKNPTGTVVASQQYLFPQVNDTAPNCGMRLILTDLNEKSLPSDKRDELFKLLVKRIPTKKYIGTKIPFELVMKISRHGLDPLLKYFKTRTLNEKENCYQQGNFVKERLFNRDIYDVIPKTFLRIAKYRMGILGAAGNHFLDLLKITEIKEKSIAEKFKIAEGQLVFLLHTGSSLVGQYASYMYTPKSKEHLSQKMVLWWGTLFFDSQMKKVYSCLSRRIKDYSHCPDFLAFEEDNLEGKMFLRSHQAAANFGFANRSVINHNLDLALEEILGKPAKLELLYDTPHVFINHEKHFKKDVWIHRNGAVSANGPSRMNQHPLFSQTGEPVFIPSSMSTPAFLAVGTDENEITFCSASHGTGKRREPEEKKPVSKKELFSKMEQLQVRLYNARSQGIILQDSAYYKDAEETLQSMTENRLLKVVAKMEPMSVLMY